MCSTSGTSTQIQLKRIRQVIRPRSQLTKLPAKRYPQQPQTKYATTKKIPSHQPRSTSRRHDSTRCLRYAFGYTVIREFMLNNPLHYVQHYKPSWKSANNHFQRYSDVKPREERPTTVIDLANQASVMQKVNGWKIFHLNAQMEDLVSVVKFTFESFTILFVYFIRLRLRRKSTEILLRCWNVWRAISKALTTIASTNWSR